jgi:RimJ/RimL family protein N-acetyltransferase
VTIQGVNVGRLVLKKAHSLDLSSLLIEGERLSLQSLTNDFSAAMFAEFNSDITRYMIPKPAENISDTLSFIADSIKGMKQGGELVLAIVNNRNGEFLGCCGFHGRDKYTTPEIGIWLKKSAHGKKYGLEAIKILYLWAVENIDFNYAIYPVDKANVASRKIPEALGGVVYQEIQKKSFSGNILDEVVYKIPYATISSAVV